MARYGIDFLGTAFYGATVEPEFITVAGALTVIPSGYDTLVLNWQPASATEWIEAVLVRSAYGYPMAPDEGETLLTMAPDAAEGSYTDSGLTSGRWYYYSLFYLTSDATPQWVRATSISSPVTEDYEYGLQLYNYLPEVWRVADAGVDTQPIPSGPVYTYPLQRFMGMFGYHLDVFRTYVDTLNTRRVELMPPAPMEALARDMGLEWEAELGVAAMRRILHEAVAFYKGKGTGQVVENVTTEYTGWAATVSTGYNLMLTNAVSSAEGGQAGTWASLNNTAVTVASAPVSPKHGSFYLKLAAIASADMNITHAVETRYLLDGIPIVGGKRYQASAHFFAATLTRSCTVFLDWYDKDGLIISTASASATNSTSVWTQVVVTAQAPTTAWFAVVRLKVAAPAAAEIHYVDAVMLADYPNLLADLSADTSLWTAGASTTLAVSTAQVIQSGMALAMTRTGTTGTASAQATQYVPVLPSTAYNAWASFRSSTPAGLRACTVGVEWFDSAFASISTSTSAAVTEIIGSWTTCVLAATSPAGAAYAKLIVTAPAALTTEIHYVDTISLHPTADMGYEAARLIKITIDANRINRLTNPSFEVSTANWTATNNTLARSSTQAFKGTWSGRMTCTATSPATITQVVNVSPSDYHTISAYFRAGTTGRLVHVEVDWLTYSLGALTTVVGTAVADVASGWVRASLVAQAPSTARKARIRCSVVGAANTEIHYVDAVMVEKATVLAPYFDASTGAIVADNLWSGTAHLSESHYYSRRAIKNARLLTALIDFIPAGMQTATYFAVASS